MLLSAVSVLVVAQSISEIPEGLMNNPVYVASVCSVAVVWCLTHPGHCVAHAPRNFVVSLSVFECNYAHNETFLSIRVFVK